MVEVTDKLIEKLYEKYSLIIKKKITNYKYRNTRLVDDIINEVFVFVLKELGRLKDERAIKFHFKYYWILEGIRSVDEKHFGRSNLIREKDIKNFQEKVNYLMETGYLEAEAKEYVIIDESLRKGRLIGQIQPHDDNPEWFDVVASLLPEIQDVDRMFIQKRIEYCLNQLRKRKTIRNPERDFMIISDIISTGEKQKDIAAKYKITSGRVKHIKDRDFPLLKRCLCEQLELDKIWDTDCEEIS